MRSLKAKCNNISKHLFFQLARAINLFVFDMKMQSIEKYHNLILGRYQSSRTDSSQQQISVVFCKFSANKRNVECPKEGIWLSRVEILVLCLNGPVGVACIAWLEVADSSIVKVNCHK